MARIGAVMVVQNDAETIEASLGSFYDYVEKILVSSDPHRGWTGARIIPDDTIDRVRALDRDKKIDVIEGNFYRYSEPMRNETSQRQESLARLNRAAPGLEWVVQVDADEVFIDFPSVITELNGVPRSTLIVWWRWISLFQHLGDGRYLAVSDRVGNPFLERFPLAHRPNARLKRARVPHLPLKILRRYIPYEHSADMGKQGNRPVLHYSFAKSEARVMEKLKTWSHAHQLDPAAFFDLWKRSRHSWDKITNFHPLYPPLWPALRPFTLEELLNRY